MNKKEALLEIRRMSIEDKIAKLSATEEAYVRGFIEGATLDNQRLRQLSEGSQGKRIKILPDTQKPNTD